MSDAQVPAKTAQSNGEDLLRVERNLVEFTLGMMAMLKSLPPEARGIATIKAELVHEKPGEPPALAFRVNF